MLKLLGRADASGLAGPVADDVWRVCLPEDADSDRSGAGAKAPPSPSHACCGTGRPHPPGTASTSWPDTSPG